MVKSNNIRSTWTSIKSKIQCSIVMFTVIALASGLIGLICYFSIGNVFRIYTAQTNWQLVPFNLSNTFSPMLISTIIGTFLFTIFYSVRNSQSQTFTLGINRSSHYLSNLISSIFYSFMFSIVALIFELIIRNSIINSSIFIDVNYKILSIKAIFSSFFITICFSFLTYSLTSAIANSIINKRYSWLLILLMIAIILFVTLLFTVGTITSYCSNEASTKLYNFILSCAGIGSVALFISAIIEGFNYCLIRCGGIRR